MKKKIRMLIITAISAVMLCGCPGNYWNKINVEISVNPINPAPNEDVTVKCSNYNMFDYGTVDFHSTDYCDEPLFYNDCFRIKQNCLDGNSCAYGSYYTRGSVFKKKISDREAVYTIAANAVSSHVDYYGNFRRRSTADGCDKNNMLFDDLMYNIEKIYINYPKYLTLNKTSAKPGDKVTITSSQPFFDTATFSDKKLAKLFAADYYIVWYSVEYVSDNWSGNIEKKALSNIAVDLDTLTPTSVTFTVPEGAITGTIHILNEGGFVTDNTNDVGLVGNVPNAAAYYSTKEVLTITE